MAMVSPYDPRMSSNSFLTVVRFLYQKERLGEEMRRSISRALFCILLVTLVFRMIGMVEAQRSSSKRDELFDLVLVQGRVMDPESNLDAIRNVGVRGGRIAAISTEIGRAHV